MHLDFIAMTIRCHRNLLPTPRRRHTHFWTLLLDQNIIFTRSKHHLYSMRTETGLDSYSIETSHPLLYDNLISVSDRVIALFTLHIQLEPYYCFVSLRRLIPYLPNLAIPHCEVYQSSMRLNETCYIHQGLVFSSFSSCHISCPLFLLPPSPSLIPSLSLSLSNEAWKFYPPLRYISRRPPKIKNLPFSRVSPWGQLLPRRPIFQPLLSLLTLPLPLPLPWMPTRIPER